MTTADSASPLATAATAAGVSVEEIAVFLDLNLSWAWDLWNDNEDGEIHTLTLGKFHALAEWLRVPVTDLVCKPSARVPIRASFGELAKDALSFRENNKMSVEEFSDLVGWDMQAFFDRTESVWMDWNLETLQDVCQHLERNWPDYLTQTPSELRDFTFIGEEEADLAAWRALSFQQFVKDDDPDERLYEEVPSDIPQPPRQITPGNTPEG